MPVDDRWRVTLRLAWTAGVQIRGTIQAVPAHKTVDELMKRFETLPYDS
jgi:hypothetical protein